MNPEAKQASVVIDSVAKAVANWTVDRHAETNPQLLERYGATWRADWIGHTIAQIHLLAQCVAVRSTELLEESVRWTSESFKCRGVDEADLVRNAECMRHVLAEELPPPVGERCMAYIDAAIEELKSLRRSSESDGSYDDGQGETILKYLEAILEGDRAEAESVVFATLKRGLSVPQIYESVLAPAQVRLGWMWHRGEITVADEHFGTATTQGIMTLLRPRFQRASPKDLTVIGTSTPGDLHDIGLRMVVDLFEIDGWNVLYLGANTPSADVIELLERRGPDLVTLSVSTALTLRDAGELIEDLRDASAIAETKVLIGGPPFVAVPDLWRELRADGCASSATEAVELGNTLVSA